ncbi:hypothetical protein ACFZBU_47325 [Embleya sp. NPDC008237]|uniref:effector-associated constant component EACC1 n=1 Tax=Embleya sp. NPDC008237 TaxID=3363978 RepID=UPI0036E824A9
MYLEIIVDHPDREGELRALYAWLLADERLASTGPELASSRPIGDGEMGPGLDLIQLGIDGGLGIANLALAVATWRRSRVEPPSVELRRGEVSVVLRGADDDDVRRIIAVLDQ